MAQIIDIAIEVIEPGDQADSILKCLAEKYSWGRPLEVRLANVYDVPVRPRADLTHEQGREEVAAALKACDEGWQACIEIIEP